MLCGGDTCVLLLSNGPEFENRIRQNEVNNPKFNFLNPTDAYHAYYQHKVKEFKEGKGGHFLQLQRPTQEPIKIPEVFVPKDPPAEFEFIVDPPSISAYELDVVKLTAQFVARNGRQFLTTVMQREQRNYLFDFLRPQHSLFNYFTKLVEQYTKILDEVRYRVEWLKFQEREKKKEEDALERERVAYAQIDWHDFVVVETVDFQQNETGGGPDQYLISPITKEKIPAHKVQEHMRIDWGEEKRATKVVWDDTPASMEKVSQRARENISIEEQIATIHKTKGLV
nr:hypothetical protein BaRGS_017410 [Batillaria attramentaria]